MKQNLRIVLVGCLSALVFSCQVGISFLPNVELVTILFIVYAHNLKLSETISIVVIFTLLEGIVWGFSDWVIGYLWIWPILVILSITFKPLLKEDSSKWAIFAAIWGLLFGFLFSVQHAVIYGISAGIAYWINGLVFDIIHCVSNYIITLLLFTPLTQNFAKIYTRLENTYGNHN